MVDLDLCDDEYVLCEELLLASALSVVGRITTAIDRSSIVSNRIILNLAPSLKA